MLKGWIQPSPQIVLTMLLKSQLYIGSSALIIDRPRLRIAFLVLFCLFLVCWMHCHLPSVVDSGIRDNPTMIKHVGTNSCGSIYCLNLFLYVMSLHQIWWSSHHHKYCFEGIGVRLEKIHFTLQDTAMFRDLHIISLVICVLVCGGKKMSFFNFLIFLKNPYWLK